MLTKNSEEDVRPVKNSSEVFNIIYNKYYKQLVKSVRRFAGRDSEDVVQSMFAKLWYYQSHLKLDTNTNLMPHLYRSSFNIFLTQFNNNKEVTSEKILIEESNRKSIPSYMFKYSNTNEGIIIGNLVFGYSMKELAKLSNKSTKTIWRLLKAFKNGEYKLNINEIDYEEVEEEYLVDYEETEGGVC